MCEDKTNNSAAVCMGTKRRLDQHLKRSGVKSWEPQLCRGWRRRLQRSKPEANLPHQSHPNDANAILFYCQSVLMWSGWGIIVFVMILFKGWNSRACTLNRAVGIPDSGTAKTVGNVRQLQITPPGGQNCNSWPSCADAVDGYSDQLHLLTEANPCLSKLSHQ